jgi:putative endonuclease
VVSRDAYDRFIAVYMMSNRKHGVIYTGVTSRLPERVRQHRDGEIEGFTKRYGLGRLVWFETHELMTAAIQREKSLKKYPRDWKTNLIERDNPDWADLYAGLIGFTDYERWPAPRPPQA